MDAAWAAIGIFAQIAIFLFSFSHSARARSSSLSLLYASACGTYGYALLIAFSMLLSVPWQATNLTLSVVALASLFSPDMRRAVAGGVRKLGSAAVRAPLAVLIAMLAASIPAAIAIASGELSVDGLLYHGPTAALLTQSGSLWGWAPVNEYAYYTNLTAAGNVSLSMAFGDARLDNAIQIPHLLIFFLLCNWALERRIGSPTLRIAIALLIVSAPVIWLQTRIMYVDLAYGTAVAAAILLTAYIREYRIFDVLTFSVFVASIFATKPTGISTGLIILVVYLGLFRWRNGNWRVESRFPGAFFVALAAPLMCGASFYIRNLIELGNPVYPVRVSLGPISLPGLIDLSVFATGDRGNGLIDASRWVSYATSILTGTVEGVTKLDYDPRSGGFGYMPLFVVMIALLLATASLRTSRRRDGIGRRFWSASGSAIIFALSAAILLTQPSTFDARYVIGPTVALLLACFLHLPQRIPRALVAFSAVSALAVAAAQVVWVETTMYGGVKTVLDIMTGPPEWQPVAPAHQGRSSPALDWLPDDCVQIAVQSAGGLTSEGLKETSRIAALPYGLYGSELCNTVTPIVLETRHDAPPLESFDYLVLYDDDRSAWLRSTAGERPACWRFSTQIAGSESFPERGVVLQNICA